ncbi:P1 family peptidase [candidate division KSB1 bacterium]|nr:P1 family peptidase [candidate division KSB1 bacterium]RQW02439.1 MAG: peptidase S58 family protein [candidate division KSB1 bacterium]
MKTTICDVPGIKVGHFCFRAAQTGCTVILPTKEVIAGVDVRGAAPGTREIELLKPVRLVEKIHAILLTGGSAFGLDAAGGVQRYLEERNIGFDAGVARIPIVPTAVIYDLAVGDPTVRPDAAAGYQACQNATAEDVEEGRVGAGCGATVGKLLGMPHCSAGGIGTASISLADGVIIGALAVVNALGEVIDEQGDIIAGVQNPDQSGYIPSLDILRKMTRDFGFASNTTLAVVATNAALTRESATKVAQMAHDGVARSIRPAHTMHDGDIVFAISTGDHAADVTVVGSFAAQVVAESIRQAVR